MPLTEGSISVGATLQEQTLSGDDYENLYDAGPYDIGRYDAHLVLEEGSISSGGSFTEGSIANAGLMLEQTLTGDDYENLADAGPAEIGRADLHQVMTEGTISAQ